MAGQVYVNNQKVDKAGYGNQKRMMSLKFAETLKICKQRRIEA